jgi:hypothetical protein
MVPAGSLAGSIRKLTWKAGKGEKHRGVFLRVLFALLWRVAYIRRIAGGTLSYPGK